MNKTVTDAVRELEGDITKVLFPQLNNSGDCMIWTDNRRWMWCQPGSNAYKDCGVCTEDEFNAEVALLFWHELGTLPPEGEVCEVNCKDLVWRECKIIARTTMPHAEVAVFQVDGGEPEWYASPKSFRPLKSDEDRGKVEWIINAHFLTSEFNYRHGAVLGKLYDLMKAGMLAKPGG